jgi:hypothetical protein
MTEKLGDAESKLKVEVEVEVEVKVEAQPRLLRLFPHFNL